MRVRALRARAVASRRPALLTADRAAAQRECFGRRCADTAAGRGRSAPCGRPRVGWARGRGAVGVFAQQRAAAGLGRAPGPGCRSQPA